MIPRAADFLYGVSHPFGGQVGVPAKQVVGAEQVDDDPRFRMVTLGPIDGRDGTEVVVKVVQISVERERTNLNF